MEFSAALTGKSNQSDAAQCKANLWREHILAWETSGLTQPDYCQQHSISLASFGYWRTRLKRPSSQGKKRLKEAPRFLPIQLSATQSSAQITVRTPQGLSIDLDSGFNPQLLREVLQVLVTMP